MKFSRPGEVQRQFNPEPRNDHHASLDAGPVVAAVAGLIARDPTISVDNIQEDVARALRLAAASLSAADTRGPLPDRRLLHQRQRNDGGDRPHHRRDPSHRRQGAWYILEATATLPESSTSNGTPSSMGGSGMNKKAGGAMSGGTKSSNSMNAANPSPVMGGQFSVREGMYVSTGQSLFKVVDDTRLWAEVYFPAKEGAQIKKGEQIELHVKGSQKAIQAKVDFIQPFFSEGKQFLQVRSYIDVGKNEIRVGQLLTAHVVQAHDQALWVPKKAILDLGVQQIVFTQRERYLHTLGSWRQRQPKPGRAGSPWP